jgi:bifunctional ADP-heptose synthase (sugar kinase/adenylyltransferase)
MIALERLQALLHRFPDLTIGLLGDLFLDRYLDIDRSLDEPSIETGLTAYQVARVRNSPGALGTVINNLAALGVGNLVPVTVLGQDGGAYDLLQALAPLPVDTQFILRDPGRMTPTYTKPLREDDSGQIRELNRLDLITRAPLSEQIQQTLLEQVSQVFETCDGLIVLDQIEEPRWGVVNPAVRDHLKELSRADPDKLMFIDSRAHIGAFDCGVLKPNLAECLQALDPRETPPDAKTPDALTTASRAAAALVARSGRPLFCTLGADGILVAPLEAAPQHAPGIPVEGDVDIVGAGDSATSGIVAALLAGATPLEAATVGNLVASITVQQLGTTGTATADEVLARWHEAQDA